MMKESKANAMPSSILGQIARDVVILAAHVIVKESLMSEYHGSRMFSYIEDWAPPQKPVRRCNCGTIISQYNPAFMCHVCMRKFEATK